MGALHMTVEIAPGTSEADAARALVRLALRVNILVTAKHNGVEMFAYPDDTAEEVIQRFDRERNLQKSGTASNALRVASTVGPLG